MIKNNLYHKIKLTFFLEQTKIDIVCIIYKETSFQKIDSREIIKDIFQPKLYSYDRSMNK